MDRGDQASRFGSALLPRLLLASRLRDFRMLGSTLRLLLLEESIRMDLFPRCDP